MVALRNISQYCFRHSKRRLGTDDKEMARAENQGLRGITPSVRRILTCQKLVENQDVPIKKYKKN